MANKKKTIDTRPTDFHKELAEQLDKVAEKSAVILGVEDELAAAKATSKLPLAPEPERAEVLYNTFQAAYWGPTMAARTHVVKFVDLGEQLQNAWRAVAGAE
jgi:hypothetical protein